jgi:hypothetical protein
VDSNLKWGRYAAVVLVAAVGSGCATTARYRGLVDASDERGVRLVESSGQTWKLATGEDAPLFADLGGCRVMVEGPRRGRSLLVRDWVVTDAGDGSAPYIGTLNRVGLRWSVEDRQTGATFFLEEESLGDLSAYVGRTVLVAGYVTGPNRVNVVRWRVLGPE